MKRMILAMGTVALACGTAGAENVATLTCKAAETSGSLAASTTANVSYYEIGVTASANSGSQSSGAGAGKVTFSTAVVHTALSTFEEFANHTAAGGLYQSCKLRATTRSGSTLVFDLKLVGLTSVKAVGGDADVDKPEKQTAYTELTLQYGALQVGTLNPLDDGGTGSVPSGGWNRVRNAPVPEPVTMLGATPSN